MSVESHELLNYDEFKARLEPEGFDRHALGNVFFALIRSKALLFEDRTAEDIGYFEINRQGELEAALSVPNLTSMLENIEIFTDIHGIGKRSIEICRRLVEISDHQRTPAPDTQSDIATDNPKAGEEFKKIWLQNTPTMGDNNYYPLTFRAY